MLSSFFFCMFHNLSLLHDESFLILLMFYFHSQTTLSLQTKNEFAAEEKTD